MTTEQAILAVLAGGAAWGFLYGVWKTVHTILTRKPSAQVCPVHESMKAQLDRIEGRLDLVLDKLMDRA